MTNLTLTKTELDFADKRRTGHELVSSNAENSFRQPRLRSIMLEAVEAVDFETVDKQELEHYLYAVGKLVLLPNATSRLWGKPVRHRKQANVCPICRNRSPEYVRVHGELKRLGYCKRCTLKLYLNGVLVKENGELRKPIKRGKPTTGRPFKWRNVAKMFAKFLPLSDHDWQEKQFAEDSHTVGYNNARIRRIRSQETFWTKTLEVESELKRLPRLEKQFIRFAYGLSAKAPKQERMDLFQTLYLNLKVQYQKDGIADDGWLYQVAHNTVSTFWAKLKLQSQYEVLCLSELVEREELDCFSDYGDTGNMLDKSKVDFRNDLRTVWHDNPIVEGRLLAEYDKHHERKQERAKRVQENHAVTAFLAMMQFENSIAGTIGNADAKVLWTALPKDVRRIVAKRMIGTATSSTERSRLKRYIASRRSWFYNWISSN